MSLLCKKKKHAFATSISLLFFIKEKQDYGRPWTTHEAFTIILKKQVKALVALGAGATLEVSQLYNCRPVEMQTQICSSGDIIMCCSSMNSNCYNNTEALFAIFNMQCTFQVK